MNVIKVLCDRKRAKLNLSKHIIKVSSHSKYFTEKLTSAGGDKTKERVPNEETHINDPNNNSKTEVCALISKHYCY